MPLTPFQKGVAQILAKHRNPESHVAGGAVINRGEGGVRISDDLDIFHDLAASVAAAAENSDQPGGGMARRHSLSPLLSNRARPFCAFPKQAQSDDLERFSRRSSGRLPFLALLAVVSYQ